MKLNETSIEFKNVQKSSEGYITYLYFVKNESGEVIGSCFLRVFDEDCKKATELGNLGYEIDQPHRGRGHAKNAAKMLLKEAKALGFSSVFISSYENNLPSISVCRALGAEKIGEFTKNGRRIFTFLKNLESI